MMSDPLSEAVTGDDPPRTSGVSNHETETTGMSSSPGGNVGPDFPRHLLSAYEQIIQAIEHAQLSPSDRSKFVEDARQIVNEQDPQHVGRRIGEKHPSLKHVAARIDEVEKKHPPLWTAWLLGLIIPAMMPTGLFGQSAEPPPLPEEQVCVVQQSADPPPSPDPEWLCAAVNQLSPQALRGLSPAEQAAVMQKVAAEMMKMLPSVETNTVASAPKTIETIAHLRDDPPPSDKEALLRVASVPESVGDTGGTTIIGPFGQKWIVHYLPSAEPPLQSRG